MSWVIVFLIFLLAASVCLNAVLGLFLFRASKMLFTYEDNIDKALDKLDRSYSKITATLKLPLFFNDPIVTNVLRDISSAREAVLFAANMLVAIPKKKLNDKEQEDSTV